MLPERIQERKYAGLLMAYYVSALLTQDKDQADRTDQEEDAQTLMKGKVPEPGDAWRITPEEFKYEPYHRVH